MLREPVAPAIAAPIGTGIVTDRPATAAMLAKVLADDEDICVIGVASSLHNCSVLKDPSLRVLVVNVNLGTENGNTPGLDFIRNAKRSRPDVGVLSLKRQADEGQLRAALVAGADACCLAVIHASRLRNAIRVVAAGATWLDQELTRTLFPDDDRPRTMGRAAKLSPREREILKLLIEGYSNQEIAERLNCSNPTVRTHLTHLYRKINVNDRVSAAVYGLRNGLD